MSQRFLVLVTLSWTLVWCSGAAAQNPDSLPAQTDSTRPVHNPLVLLGVLGVIAAVYIAPPAMLPFLASRADSSALAGGIAGPDYLEVRTSAGLMIGETPDKTSVGGCGSLVIEASAGPLYAAATVDRSWASPAVRISRASLGYLWRPRPEAAGGMTLGIADVSARSSVRGLDIGLPLFLGSPHGRAQFEVGYVLASDDSAYRMRLEAEFGRARLTSGLGGAIVVPSATADDVFSSIFLFMSWHPWKRR
jgi:hypothetical protein